MTCYINSHLKLRRSIILGNSGVADQHMTWRLFRREVPIGDCCFPGFVGLDNAGMTCYMNSLLQTLFMTQEFRAAILALSPHEIGVEAYEIRVRCLLAA